MPTYRVKSAGFYGGTMYDPDGKRKTLTVDLPFNGKDRPFPSWVDKKPISAKAAGKASGKAAGKASDDPSFIGEDETTAQAVGNVTTL
jgi:hypothetical protein